MAKTPALPKRFQPLQSQADTEAAIRYGGPMSALQSIFNSTTSDYQHRAQAQDTATRSLLGALQAAPGALTKGYSDAGLTPSVLAAIANSPTGQRLAGELAAGQAGILQQQTSAQAGGVYQQQHLGDQYREDVGKINDQATALATERGQFTQSLLDQLIGTDRSTRHTENVHRADQQFTADQNLLDNTTSTGNALIGQGIDPSTGQPIPGAKSNRPKPKAKPHATPGEQSKAEGAFSRALAGALAGIHAGQSAEVVRRTLENGIAGTKGRPVHEKVKDPVTGKEKWVPKIDPKTGIAVTTGDSSAVAAVDPDIAQAAVEMATQGYVSPATVKQLHRLGYQVRGFPRVKTWADQQKRPAAPVGGIGTGTGNPAGAPYNGLG